MARQAHDVVRARVNREAKQEAAEVLAAIGPTPSDAYRMPLARIVEERALPSELLVPNATTIAATMPAARAATRWGLRDVEERLVLRHPS